MVKWGSVARPKQNLEPFSPDVDVSYSYLLELVIVITRKLIQDVRPGIWRHWTVSGWMRVRVTPWSC